MIDWAAMFHKYNALGIWHAVRFLATISSVKDPAELAYDVVQQAWFKLWRANKFSKALFVTSVINLAYTEAARTRPIETLRKNEVKRSGPKGVLMRLTGLFPVQIFGAYLGEETRDEAVSGPSCGDE